MIRSFLTLILLLSILSGPSHANEEDIQALQKFVDQNMLQFDLLNGSGLTETNLIGETTIVDQGDYYSITMPLLEIKALDFQITVPPMLINAKRGKEQNWNMSMAIPKMLTVYDLLDQDAPLEEQTSNPEVTKKTKMADIFIGAQSNKFIWNEAVNIVTFSKIDLDDVSVQSSEDIKFELEGFDMVFKVLNSNYNDADLSSQISLKNILFSEANKGKLKISSIDLNTKNEGFDLIANSQILEDLKSRLKEHKKDDGNNKENWNSLVEFYKQMQTIYDGTGYSGLAIKGIDIESANKTGPTARIYIEDIKSKYTLSGDDSLSTIVSTFSLSGLSAEALRETSKEIHQFISGYIPNNIVFNFRVDDLPKNIMQDYLDNTLTLAEDNAPLETNNADSDAVNKEKARDALDLMQTNIEDIKASLSDANTTFVLNPFTLSAQKYNVDVNGNAFLKTDSAKGFIVDTTIRLGKLDALIVEASNKISEGQNLSEAQKQILNNALVFAPMVKGFGQPVPLEDGSIEYEYKLQLTETGQFLMNGRDMSTLLGGVGQK